MFDAREVPQMPCLQRISQLCNAVSIPAAIVATVFLASFIYSCYRGLVTPALSEASAVPATLDAGKRDAPLQKQEIPVIVVQSGEQVGENSSQCSAWVLLKGG